MVKRSAAELRAESKDWPRVAELFAGRHVLVTGGTGFMGKVLIEKLLYSCPDVAKIYIIVRPKRGKSEDARITEMFNLPLFKRIRAERPNAASKVVPIPGDLYAEGLGLSPEHKALLQKECSIVFHCAATLKLEAALKDSVLQNLCATSYVIELVKGMPKLISFLHLSTAFCHGDQLLLEEETYDPLHDPEEVMRLVKNTTDEKELQRLEQKLMPPHPNTYLLTKRLAEALVRRASKDIPAAIARPSIVTPAWKEPVEGWVDNLNGPMGLTVGAGKGVIRSMYCIPEYHAEVIPVDVGINGLIGAAWRRACIKDRELQVYNVNQGRMVDITWGEVLKESREVLMEYPMENAIWYPDGNIRRTLLEHNICAFFYHLLPALLIDSLLFITGNKRFMYRIYKRIKLGLELLQFFTTREWCFETYNFHQLAQQFHPQDNEIFYTDTSKVNVRQYLAHNLMGARQYCMKEDPSTIPACRRHMKRLYWIQKITNTLFYGFLIYWVLSWSENAMTVVHFFTGSIKSAIVFTFNKIVGAVTS